MGGWTKAGLSEKVFFEKVGRKEVRNRQDQAKTGLKLLADSTFPEWFSTSGEELS